MGSADMSLWAKLVVAGVALAIVLPLMFVIVRRMIRGKPFKDSGINTMMPPLP